jgi:hypothetical protein
MVRALDTRPGAAGMIDRAATLRVTAPSRSARRMARTSSDRAPEMVRLEHPSLAIWRSIPSTCPAVRRASRTLPIAAMMCSAGFL